MIISFIVYLVLFVGGIVLMGISHGLPDFQALVFCAGLAAFCLSMAWIMRAGRSGATRRSDNWDGGPSAS
ncbi:hypothetical protein [Microbacterium murale]|uniref:Uncharacterized protein n=1 Tax=Microbacterium murale TaxID=1081040 RepID=A0ABQ1RTW6_9MICO|nr:hypothetical protein [Microbacterium murale]GGD82602.1 hypothetical protein GCM10007269_26810 [Microbacterium murale]